MRLRDVVGWPPSLSGTFTAAKILASPKPAILKGCKFYEAIELQPAYLGIIVHFQGRDWRTAIENQPVPLLKRVEATLRGHPGRPLAMLGDLEVVESA